MKINVDRNVVELRPENAQETSSLEVLWRIIVDCVKDNKRLNPIGEFVPTKENLARFVIEGLPGGKTEWSSVEVVTDCTVYCAICNKYMNIKSGQEYPLCCGRIMETMD
ncbi:MAG: hypothetical protein KKE17_10960 [Proteobacteria bacterium]|nr:hypothetical protein [Pseudomonadota bacterium]MBU1710512.1 hypothetical protein [Pseudomonadota bacterium]